MSDGTQYSPIPEKSLVADYYDNLHRAYRAMRAAFRRSGLTQEAIGRLLGNADKGLVSRWLGGRQNITLRTLSRMASAMQCALFIEFRPFDELATPVSSNFFITNDPSPQGREIREIDSEGPNKSWKPVELTHWPHALLAVDISQAEQIAAFQRHGRVGSPRRILTSLLEHIVKQPAYSVWRPSVEYISSTKERGLCTAPRGSIQTLFLARRQKRTRSGLPYLSCVRNSIRHSPR